jgi:hypothetical protein
VVDEADEGEEDGLPRGRLDDGRLANARGVQIDVGALLGRLFRNVEVKNLDNVSHKVRKLSGGCQ